MAQGMFLGAQGDYGNKPIAQPKSKEQLAKEAADQAAAQVAQQNRAIKYQQDVAKYKEATQSAQQQAQAGNIVATQQIQSANQQQQAQDAATQQAQQARMQSGGQTAIGGGGFNPAAASKSSFANIGASGGASMINPAMQGAGAAAPANQTGTASNKFTLPSFSGIKFGGF
jgi:DNA primase